MTDLIQKKINIYEQIFALAKVRKHTIKIENHNLLARDEYFKGVLVLTNFWFGEFSGHLKFWFGEVSEFKEFNL